MRNYNGVWEMDEHDGFVTLWMCPPPSWADRFVVTRQSWNDDFTERRIYEWEPQR